MSASCIVIEPFESACLKDNPLGDPYVRDLPVYLPPGYDDENKSYPVIYTLSGFAGWGARLLQREPFDEALDQRLDRLIDTGRIAPAIVVMPDCFTRYGGSQYLDSVATGPYETHIVEELVPYVDKHYRTLPGRRAVVGKSSGGYGALVLGMRHPEVFGVVACLSGDLGFEYAYLPDFPAAMVELERHGGVAGFLKAFYHKPKRSSADFLTLNVVAMAACYSPNPNSEQGFDLPFETQTGALRQDVWARWLAWDPVRMADAYHDALKQLNIFIDCGTRDEHRLFAGARQLAGKLKAMGVNHSYEEFDDGHRGLNYRYDHSLPWISERLRKL